MRSDSRSWAPSLWRICSCPLLISRKVAFSASSSFVEFRRGEVAANLVFKVLRDGPCPRCRLYRQVGRSQSSMSELAILNQSKSILATCAFTVTQAGADGQVGSTDV
jgi:hypothetical protein